VKFRLFALAAIVIPLAFASTDARAHPTQWYWSHTSAEATLYDEGLDWEEGYDNVDFAYCRGEGQWLNSRVTGRRLFRHFRCYIEADNGDTYFIRFHVLTKHRWSFTWLRWAT
jgi:hypothetical protein